MENRSSPITADEAGANSEQDPVRLPVRAQPTEPVHAPAPSFEMAGGAAFVVPVLQTIAEVVASSDIDEELRDRPNQVKAEHQPVVFVAEAQQITQKTTTPKPEPPSHKPDFDSNAHHDYFLSVRGKSPPSSPPVIEREPQAMTAVGHAVPIDEAAAEAELLDSSPSSTNDFYTPEPREEVEVEEPLARAISGAKLLDDGEDEEEQKDGSCGTKNLSDEYDSDSANGDSLTPMAAERQSLLRGPRPEIFCMEPKHGSTNGEAFGEGLSHTDKKQWE